MSVTKNSKILANDVKGAIKGITRSGTTFTYTCLDGTTGTFNQQDNNTTYSNMTAATSSAAGKAGLVPAPSAGANTKFLRGDATWQLITGLSLPAGSVIAFAGNPSSAPSGFLLCNGAKVSRTTYSALFSAIGTLYGAGDGSTTFTLPNMTDKFIHGSGTAGTVKEAGLPNITGGFTTEGLGRGRSNSPSGAFTAVNGGGAAAETDGGYTGSTFYIDASLSSPIYGASSTVQPPAITMRYYIKY